MRDFTVVRSGVHRDEALAALPEGYAVALQLREAGCADEEIAARLEVDVDVVATLLQIGDEKLRRVLAGDGSADED